MPMDGLSLLILIMKIIAIDHVQLAMPPGEEEAARRFYRDVLGFVEIPKPASLAGRGGVLVPAGSSDSASWHGNGFPPGAQGAPRPARGRTRRAHPSRPLNPAAKWMNPSRRWRVTAAHTSSTHLAIASNAWRRPLDAGLGQALYFLQDL